MTKLTMGPRWVSNNGKDLIVKPAASVNSHSPKLKIHLEIRSGKKVTVITGLLTYGTDRLNTIAKELKTSFGASGTVKNGTIEIQGDKISQLKLWLTKNL
ncbi:MAG: translation initiation factor [Endomicrobiales bacterium]|nr:translation initiation factor [Endomicrobiales bacterium]